MIYLDYSANTPVDERVLSRFAETERGFMGNPNSKHSAGTAAESRLAEITASIAKLMGVKPSEIIYTSGAAEANNTAINGIAHTTRHTGKHIISTPLEHPTVSAPLTRLQEQGYEIDLVDIGRDGIIDLEHLSELMRKDTVLVAVSAVDSELGVIQPIEKIAELLREYPNCHLHVDATQAVGKTGLVLEGVDTAAFSAHKFYGLNGSGLLYKREGLVIEPLIHGGSGTTPFRSGTPTLALAAAFETALELAVTEMPERIKRVAEHNAYLREFFAGRDKVRINSPSHAIPHIQNVSVQGVKGYDFQRTLSDRGVCVSVKSACSVEGTPSRAVYAVSRDRKNALSSFRISLSHLTTEAELRAFTEAFAKCCEEFNI